MLPQVSQALFQLGPYRRIWVSLQCDDSLPNANDRYALPISQFLNQWLGCFDELPIPVKILHIESQCSCCQERFRSQKSGGSYACRQHMFQQCTSLTHITYAE